MRFTKLYPFVIVAFILLIIYSLFRNKIANDLFYSDDLWFGINSNDFPYQYYNFEDFSNF